MALPVWINNLIAYTLQIGILAAMGTLLAYLFRLRMPRVALIYWQSLLLACLFVFMFQGWQHPASYPVAAPNEGFSLALPAKGAVEAPEASFHLDPEWIGWILGAGAGIRLVWLALGLVRLRCFRRKAGNFLQDPLLLEEVQSGVGVRAVVLFSDEMDTPVTFGIRKPVVILPARISEMNESCRVAVLCHELLHIRRRDWLFIIVEELIRSLFWFHPAIWWLLGRIRLSREQAVDYEVVRRTGNRQPYLESLLEFARAQGRPRAIPAPLLLHERHLVQRVSLLLKEVSMSRSRLMISVFGISVLLISTVHLAAAWFPLTGDPVVVQESTPAAVPSAQPAPNAVAKTDAVHPVWGTARQGNPAATKIKKVMVAENIVPNLPAETPPVQQSVSPLREPIKVGGNVQESKLIYKVEPVYPELAKRARVTGKVVLIVTANEEGLVSDVRVTSGHPLLNEAAIAAVKQWRYSSTLLNGVPVPVIFTVTCIFNFMGENDLPMTMDETGKLAVRVPTVDIEMFMPKLIQGGTAFIQIAPNTPLQVAERAVQELMRRGVQRIQLSGPFTLYQAKMFYTGLPASPPQLIPNLEKLRALLEASPAQNTPGTVNMLVYNLYINEVGEILGVQRMAGPDNPEIDRELIRSRVISPAMMGANPVSFMYTFRMGM